MQKFKSDFMSYAKPDQDVDLTVDKSKDEFMCYDTVRTQHGESF